MEKIGKEKDMSPEVRKILDVFDKVIDEAHQDTSRAYTYFDENDEDLTIDATIPKENLVGKLQEVVEEIKRCVLTA